MNKLLIIVALWNTYYVVIVVIFFFCGHQAFDRTSELLFLNILLQEKKPVTFNLVDLIN